MATIVAPEFIMSLPSNSFLSAGHVPTLFASFLYFDISFMVWVLLGSLGVQIAKLLALDPTQKGVMVAVPVLSDALLRIPFGLAADHFGARITAIVTMIPLTLGPAVIFFMGAPRYDGILLSGVLLQISGSYQAGFLIFAALALIAFARLMMVKRVWRACYESLPRVAAVRI
jgi:nitrate/nitrite transporter NarK